MNTSTDPGLSFLENGVWHRLRELAESQMGRPTPPGVWMGSAAALARLGRRTPSPRRLREAFERLEGRGLLRTWRQSGQRGSYPILLDGHLVSERDGRRYRTDAAATADWRAPVLRPLNLLQPGPASTTAAGAKALPLSDLPHLIWKLYCRERGKLAPPPELTAERCAHYLRAARDYPGGAAVFLLDFGGALRLARRSRFLLGANRAGRPFGLDWLLRDPENLRKTLAGRYDDSFPTPDCPIESDPAPPVQPVQYELPWAETSPPSNSLPPVALTDAAAAEAEWSRLQRHLREHMNPKTFSTWIRPLRAVGYDGSTLVLSAPTGDFSRVPERFAGELPPQSPPLRMIGPHPTTDTLEGR